MPTKTGTFAFEIGLDEEFRQLAASQGEGFDFSELGDLSGPAPDGWSIGEFDDGEFAGTRVATHFANIDDLQTQIQRLEEDADQGDPTNDLVDTLEIVRDGDEFRFTARLGQLDQTFSEAGG